MKSREGINERLREFGYPLGGTGRATRRPSAGRILPACSWSHARKSRHDLPRRPFTWSRIMTSTLSARSISSGFEVRLDPAARAAGPCASPRGDCQWSGGHSTGRGRKPGGGKRTDERGLFLLCRSRVRVMVGRRLSDARADEPTSIDGKARTWRLRPS